MKNKTDITIILDRSGSMASVQDDTIGGFNSFLGEQQKDEGEAALSLVQFDDQYEVVYADKDLQNADKLNDRTFQPRGSTALYDAIGRTIQSTGQRLAALPESERPDKVVLMILTDGFENSSREFSAQKINQMIGHQRNVYSWDFVFIGANQDAVLSAHQIGIDDKAALTYAHNAQGTLEAFASVSRKMRGYRTEKKLDSLHFDEADKAAQDAAAKAK